MRAAEDLFSPADIEELQSNMSNALPSFSLKMSGSSNVFVHAALTQLAGNKDLKRIMLPIHEQSITSLLETFKPNSPQPAVSSDATKLVDLLKNLCQLAATNLSPQTSTSAQKSATVLLTSVLDLISKIIQDSHYSTYLDDLAGQVANLNDGSGNSTVLYSEDKLVLQIFKVGSFCFKSY
jgi:hypothetical protein